MHDFKKSIFWIEIDKATQLTKFQTPNQHIFGLYTIPIIYTACTGHLPVAYTPLHSLRHSKTESECESIPVPVCLCLCLLAASSSGSSLGQTLCVPREARHVLIASQVASWLKVAQVAQVTNRFKFENAFCVCVCRTSSKGRR